MALASTLKKFFNQTVTIEPWASADNYGKPTYGTAVSYSAKIEQSRTMVRDATGMELVSTRKVFLDTQTTSITPKDRITLPDAFAPTQPKILSIRTVLDLNGVNHIVLQTE